MRSEVRGNKELQGIGGQPSREEAVAQAVRIRTGRNRNLADLSFGETCRERAAVSYLSGEPMLDLLTPDGAVARRNHSCGISPEQVSGTRRRTHSVHAHTRVICAECHLCSPGAVNR